MNMITDLLSLLLKCSQRQSTQMEFALQLSSLAAAMVMMISATPSRMTCHTLSEVHANAVCKEYCSLSKYNLVERGGEGIYISLATRVLL